MTTYGGSGFVSVSTGITGSPSGPSGDNFLGFCESYYPIDKFKLKLKQNVDGSSYVSSKGKVARGVTITKCIIYDDDGNQTTNTEALNNRITFLRSLQDLSKRPAYLIITSNIDNKNVALSKGSGLTQIDYMKGYIMEFGFKPTGNAYELNFKFIEATLF
jgi:hypothetical protein